MSANRGDAEARRGLGKLELDIMAAHGCQRPGCTHCDDTIYFHQRCHPANLTVYYTRGTGLITLLCSECERKVAEIRVSE